MEVIDNIFSYILNFILGIIVTYYFIMLIAYLLDKIFKLSKDKRNRKE